MPTLRQPKPLRLAKPRRVLVAVIAVLFSLVGGFMTPVFTRNALRVLGRGDRVWRSRVVERIAHASVVAFGLAEAFQGAPRLTAAVSVCACLAHAVRLGGWRGWAVCKVPLVLGGDHSVALGTLGGLAMSLVTLVTWWGTNAFLPFVATFLAGPRATPAEAMHSRTES